MGLQNQALQLIECADLVPVPLAEVFERFNDDLGLQHVVEHGLERAIVPIGRVEFDLQRALMAEIAA